MKVILLQDVAKIGRRFEIKDVPDGYALNKLIPQRQAEPATPANVKRIEARSKKHAETAADTASAFDLACETLKDKKVEVKVDTNADGKLFESLKTQTIVAAVSDQAGVSLDDKWVHVATPIKEVGEHTVLLSLHEAQGEFTINVVSK